MNYPWHRDNVWQRHRLLMGLLSVVVLSVSTAMAQPSPSEHAKHHPKPANGGPPAQAGAGMQGGSGGGGMMGGGGGGGMGKMMEKMGAPKPKQLYPSMMALPDLPLEQRQIIQQQAHDRMKAGAVLMSEGLAALSQAAPTNDFAAMQESTAQLREGLVQFESGLAAHRALAEGKAPRNVALGWFKRQMNLLPPTGGAVNQGLLGLSWFHLFVMMLLTIFAVAMIWMYFLKMRRAATLMKRLADGDGPASPASSTVVTQKPTTSKKPAVAEQPTAAKGSAVAEKQVAADKPADADCCDDSADACPTEQDGSTNHPDILAGLLPVAKKKLCRLRVAQIFRETVDVKTFRFVACHGGGIPFSYLPGQFLTLTLPTSDKPIRRSYTISSSPTQGYYCEITVKREEHGAGSRYLHDELKEGDTLEVQGPSGKFVFMGKQADSVVLIAGGVGITPMMSITRALTDIGWRGEVYFVVACRDPEHLIFASELKRLQERYSNLHVFVTMSRLERDADGYHRGRITRQLLSQWVPDITSKWVHLCGAPPMMDSVKQMLAELGVPGENIHTENFGSQQKPKLRAGQPEKAVEAGSAQRDVAQHDKPEKGGTVTFKTSNKSTGLQPDETILEASERAGVSIDYSCRVGSCGVCTVKLLSGEVTMEVEDGLDPDDKAKGMILACQAKSTGDVEVDA